MLGTGLDPAARREGRNRGAASCLGTVYRDAGHLRATGPVRPAVPRWSRPGQRAREAPMRIVRYSHDGEMSFGVLEDQTIAAITPHPFVPFEYSGERLPTDEVRLLAPVLPTKIVAVGRNYADHAREMGNEVPDEPIIFLKPSTAVIGPDDPIIYPAGVDRVDYEGELAVIVGKMARRLDEADALQVVLGFTCANDVTARNLQELDGQWTRAKGFDTFCPLGPWIETEGLGVLTNRVVPEPPGRP